MAYEQAPIGVLVVNLGTPQAPSKQALRPYLREFLSDQRVIDYPRWLWYPILYGIILNTRPRKSAEAYRAIWTEGGSPLLVYSQRLVEQLQARLAASTAEPVKVVLAMRYGQPSIQTGLEALRAAGARRILVLPLYPQYSVTTVGTTFDVVFDVLKSWQWMPEIRTVHEYCRHPQYVRAIADSIRAQWAKHGRPDRLLFSMHGVPERYTRKGDPYECQCRDTAELVAAELGLQEADWLLTFQSRFGPEAWLQPYTDATLKQLPRDGVRHVDVICPGFAADCLETLEEIDGENRHYFEEAGGERFAYIPALNDSPAHVDLLATLVLEQCQGWVTAVAAGQAAQAGA